MEGEGGTRGIFTRGSAAPARSLLQTSLGDGVCAKQATRSPCAETGLDTNVPPRGSPLRNERAKMVTQD